MINRLYLCSLFSAFLFLSCSSVKINLLSSNGLEEFNNRVKNKHAEIILSTGSFMAKDIELTGQRLYWTEINTKQHQSTDIDSVYGVRLSNHWGGALWGLAIGVVAGTNYFTASYLKRLFSPQDITLNHLLKDSNTSIKLGLIGGGLGAIMGAAIGRKTIEPCTQIDSIRCDEKTIPIAQNRVLEK